jgi:hypothetical protein
MQYSILACYIEVSLGKSYVHYQSIAISKNIDVTVLIFEMSKHNFQWL